MLCFVLLNSYFELFHVVNTIHTSALRKTDPATAYLSWICVFGEVVLLLCGGEGGASTSPLSLPPLQCCHRLSKAAEAPRAVTDSHADKHLSMKYPCCDRQLLNVRDARPISMKYFVQLFVCMPVYMPVPFCILCMHNLCMYICICLLSIVGIGVLTSSVTVIFVIMNKRKSHKNNHNKLLGNS